MLEGMLRTMESPTRVTDTPELREALAQLGFLVVHVDADATTGEGTDALRPRERPCGS
jgi:hypothetical protein